MPMLQNVMILTGSTELNGLDVGLEKDASCTPGKNQELKKVNNTKFLCHSLLFIEVLVSSRFGIVGPVWAVAVGKSKKSSKSQIQSSQNVSLTLFVQFRNLISKVVRHSKTQMNVRSK